MILIPFLARFMINEQIYKSDIIALFISFAGLIILEDPFKESTSKDSFMNELVGSSIAILGAVLRGTTLIKIKQLGPACDFKISIAGFYLFSMLLSPIFYLINSAIYQTPTSHYGLQDILLIALAGFFNYAGQIA